MADSTISALPAGVSLSGTELLPIVQSGVTVQVPTLFVLNYVAALFSANNGASFVTYMSPATGGVPMTVAAKLQQIKDIKDVGGKGDGTTDDLAAFGNLTGGLCTISSPSSSYKLSANWQPPAADRTIIAAADISFTGNHPDYNNLIPYEAVPGPLWSQILVSKTYGAGWAGTGNLFQVASYAKANVANVDVVALYGAGEAAAAGSKAWGLNTSCYSSNATGTAIGYELNMGTLTAGGTSYGLVIASSGAGAQPLNAIQVNANEVGAQPLDGLLFGFAVTRGCVTNALLRASGDSSTNQCQNFLKIQGVKATIAEIDIPSLLVDPSPAYTNNRLRVKAGSTGNDVLVTVDAVDTNAGINIAGHGSSGGGLLDGGLNFKMKWNSTGIGFYGAAPAAKPTVTGAKGGNAALASLLTALATLGILTDSTT